MNELLQYFDSLLQYATTQGASLNAESQRALAQFLEQLQEFILQMQQNPVEELPPSLPQEPNLEPGMPSSNVNSFGYDPENERLLVKFNGKNERDNGPIYGYDGVPRVIFDLFRSGAVPARTDGQNRWGRWWKGKVPSLGASLYTLIAQGQYPYQRLS